MGEALQKDYHIKILLNTQENPSVIDYYYRGMNL